MSALARVSSAGKSALARVSSAGMCALARVSSAGMCALAGVVGNTTTPLIRLEIPHQMVK